MDEQTASTSIADCSQLIMPIVSTRYTRVIISFTTPGFNNTSLFDILNRSTQRFHWQKMSAMSSSSRADRPQNWWIQTQPPSKDFWTSKGMWRWCNGLNSSNTIWWRPFSRPWVRSIGSQMPERNRVCNLNFFTSAGNDDPIECCTEQSTDPSPRHRHPACLPLKVEVSDADFTDLPSCLNYVRSALGVNPECKFGPAQQVCDVVKWWTIKCLMKQHTRNLLHNNTVKGQKSQYLYCH